MRANFSSWTQPLGRGAVICLLIAMMPSGLAAQPFQFSDFPGFETLWEPPARPDETTAPASWAAVNPIVKDVIRDDIMKGGPNFAGAYYLATVGCGSGCEAIYIIDLRDGEIFEAPTPATNGVLFQRDSQLIIIKENAAYDLPRKYITFDGALFGELN